MSSTQETLFSLEFVIDYVRFDCTRGNVLDPVVGLRFLDFPTLLISRKENHSSHAAFADVPAEASSQPDERDKYFFHKGKSCLFKMNLDSLHNHLSNTPLYAMVLDIKDEVPKLIGSSMISLAKVTERIKMDVDKYGIGTPSAYGGKIVTPLCNLMGNSIGAISLAYKIVSLGANLIPHIPCDRVFKVGMSHGKGQQDTKALAGVLNIDKGETEMHHADVFSPVSPDGQPADVVRSEAKQPGIAAFTQTEPTKQKVTWSVSYSNDAQENTTFCPPPLFYSSSVKNQQERFAEKCRMLNVELESLNIEDPEEENNEEESADMHDVPEITAAKQHQRMADPAPPGDVLRQLPLLNALLIELSQLTSQIQHQQPVSIHPNLAWLYTSATEPHSASDPGAKHKSEYQKTLQNESPKCRTGLSKIKGCIIPPVSPLGKKGSSAKKCRENLQSKKKLKYGLTHTFCLRLKHAKTTVTQRQCIEYQNKQRVKPQKQTLLAHKHAGKSVSRDVNLDEMIETLVSSVDMDPIPVETTSSKLQMRSSAYESCTKNDKALVTKHDRKIRVHIPSVLSHYSDHSDQHSTSSDRSIHHSSHKTNAAQQYSECGRAESRASSTPHGKSSSEQEYQDDFTSLDTTDGVSPEPLSSPEPYRRQRNSGSSEHSNSDGGSNKSKVLPVPVKAENSPHRSLKSTHVIRPRPQTSALSLSSDDSGDGSPLPSSGQQRTGSQRSGRKTSVRRTFGRSESFDADPADGRMTLSQVSVDSVVVPTNNSVLKSVSSLDQVESAEEQDELGSLGLDKNYQHVSELVINKLPGYTL